MDALARQRAATVAVWKADVSTRPGGDWADLGGLAVHTTGLDVPHWNGAHLTGPAGLANLPRAREWFATRSMPWALLVPEELDTDHGLEHLIDQRVMLRSLDDLDRPPDLELRWDAAADASAVQSEAFGEPLPVATEFVVPKLSNAACAVVVGYDGRRAVSTATLVSVDGVAAVYGVGTVPSHRRTGLGAALTVAVLHEGRRRGCDLAFLNPSPMGHGMYGRLGFEDAPGWRVYRTLADTVGAAE
jgi:GNAT superfamily N-acetyltransferase